MTDPIQPRGRRGESFADVARRTGEIAGVEIPADASDQEVLDAAVGTITGAIADAEASLDAKVAAAAEAAGDAENALSDAQAIVNDLGANFSRLPGVYDALADGFEALYVNVSSASGAVSANGSDILFASLDEGVDVQVGAVIDRLGMYLSAGATAANVKLDVYKLATADGGINTPATIIGGTSISEVTTTPDAIGMPTGANPTPVLVVFDLETPIIVEADTSYFPRVRVTDGSSAKVATGYGYRTVGSNDAHERGWRRTVSSDTWTAESNTRRLVVNVYTRAMVDVVGMRGDVDDLITVTAPLRNVPAVNALDLIGGMLAANASALDLHVLRQTVTATAGTVAWGDSITAGYMTATSWVPMLGSFLTSSAGAGLDNQGAGGQTSTQVKTRVEAATGTQKAAFNYFMFGTNNPTDVPTILADYASSVATLAHTNYLVVAPIFPNNAATSRADQQRLARQLIETYGARAIDLPTILRYEALSQQAHAPLILGHTGTFAFQDEKHPTTAGNLILAEHFARAQRAMLGGQPYIHHDTLAWHSAMSPGDVIGTPRYLGTCTDWEIVGGNADDFVRINHATGQITRGAGTNYPVKGVRQILVRGRGPYGTGPGTAAVVTLVRTAETAQPIYPVRMNPINLSGLYGAMLRAKGASESYALVASNAKFSLVIRHQFIDVTTIGQHGSGISGFIQRQTVGRIRLQVPQSPSGAALADVTLPTPADALGINWYFFSFDGSTGAWTAACNGSSSSGTGTAGTVRLADWEGLFNLGDGSNAPWLGNHYMTWLAAGEAIDWTSSTERERFYDPADFEPQMIAADGEVNGVAPAVYVRGRAGDYYTAPNKAPGGLQLYPPPPLSPQEMLFEDVS